MEDRSFAEEIVRRLETAPDREEFLQSAIDYSSITGDLSIAEIAFDIVNILRVNRD